MDDILSDNRIRRETLVLGRSYVFWLAAVKCRWYDKPCFTDIYSMKNIKPFIAYLTIWSILITSTSGYSEAINDRYTHIAPGQGPGEGEFVHGSGYGKILIRVLMFGSIPQQGIHYMPEGTDLLFGILYAGGYGNQTKLNGITIRRREVKDLMEIDLEDILEEGAPVPELKNGDVVNIPFNWKKSWEEFNFITTFLMSISTFLLSVVALTK